MSKDTQTQINIEDSVAASSEETHFPLLSTKQVVMVEDDPFLRDLYTRIFEREKVEFHIAHDGEEGLDMIEDLDPDIILLDVMLPGMTGIQILQELKDDKNLAPDTPIIMLSDLDQIGVEERAKELGAIGFLSKNEITGVDLLRRLEEVFANMGAVSKTLDLLDGK